MMKLDKNTSCGKCKRLASSEEFKGVWNELGYTCGFCIKEEKKELYEKLNNQFQEILMVAQ